MPVHFRDCNQRKCNQYILKGEIQGRAQRSKNDSLSKGEKLLPLSFSLTIRSKKVSLCMFTQLLLRFWLTWSLCQDLTDAGSNTIRSEGEQCIGRAQWGGCCHLQLALSCSHHPCISIAWHFVLNPLICGNGTGPISWASPTSFWSTPSSRGTFLLPSVTQGHPHHVRGGRMNTVTLFKVTFVHRCTSYRLENLGVTTLRKWWISQFTFRLGSTEETELAWQVHLFSFLINSLNSLI